jgi:BirA family biotin operon repressor/biotin-[acetyl-CoA-carboxylase] ligase
VSDRLGTKIYRYQSVDSTQTEAEKLAIAGASHGTVVLATEQLAGRGRLGRSWHSAADKGIWLSIVLRPQFRIDYLAQITLISSLAIQQTLNQLYGMDVKIKWPNDIYYGDNKLAGILTQARIVEGTAAHVILGIGLNTDKTAFPDELLAKPISIEDAIGYPPDKVELINALLTTLAKLYDAYEQTGFTPFLSQYNDKLYRKGEAVIVNQQSTGRIANVNVRGELIVIDDAGTELIVTSGEIKFAR